MRTKTSVPIPKILAWNDNPSNTVGSEYIIEQHVEGTPLHEKWPCMNMHQHMLCTKAISLQIKEMASLNFPAFGSLYFLDAPIHESKKIPIDNKFCIGPHCSPVFWHCNPGELELYGGPSPNCGPWRDLSSYCSGLIETGHSRIPSRFAFLSRFNRRSYSLVEYVPGSHTKIN